MIIYDIFWWCFKIIFEPYSNIRFSPLSRSHLSVCRPPREKTPGPPAPTGAHRRGVKPVGDFWSGNHPKKHGKHDVNMYYNISKSHQCMFKIKTWAFFVAETDGWPHQGQSRFLGNQLRKTVRKFTVWIRQTEWKHASPGIKHGKLGNPQTKWLNGHLNMSIIEGIYGFSSNPCFIVRGYICNPTPSLLNPQENPWFSIRSIHELGPSHGIKSHTGNLTQLWMLWSLYIWFPYWTRWFSLCRFRVSYPDVIHGRFETPPGFDGHVSTPESKGALADAAGNASENTL